jgi:electron transport complex protein RnfC
MEMPCIRCGDCADACPAQLRPQALLRELLAQRPGAAMAQGLGDCSECGACDLACPSRIELRARFAAAKQAAVVRERVLEAAAAARARFEARGLRLEREAREREQREAAQKLQLDSADPVAAALARAQAKRRPPTGPA